MSIPTRKDNDMETGECTEPPAKRPKECDKESSSEKDVASERTAPSVNTTDEPPPAEEKDSNSTAIAQDDVYSFTDLNPDEVRKPRNF